MLDVLRAVRDILLPILFTLGGVLLLVIGAAGDFRPLLRQPLGGAGRWAATAIGALLVILGAGLYLVAVGAQRQPEIARATLPSASAPTSTPVRVTPTPTTQPVAGQTPSPTPAVTSVADVITMDERGHTLRLIPAGTITMGGSGAQQPGHTVTISAAYWMDIYEVNNRQYQACVDSKLCQPPHAVSSSTRPNYYGSADFDYYPVVNIDRAMADLFCSQWRGGRLPSEDEWEFAARGPVGQAFPWGDQPATCVLANLSAGSGCAQDTQPVTAFPAGSSVYGIANMIGNVWEWVGGSGGDGLLKGGAWDSQADAINASTRLEKPPASFADDAGFRCARGS